MSSNRSWRKWTEEEDKFLHDNYTILTRKQCGKALNRSVRSIGARMFKFGLTSGNNIGQFTNGSKPWNHGIKGLHHSPATEFKKGSIPANTKHDGFITTRNYKRGRAYKYIRIGKCNWKLYHQYVWEQENGPIPEGLILRFINGDSTDVRIDNLELVSRKKQMRDNHNTEKTAVSMKRIWDNGVMLNNDNVIVSYISPRDKGLRKEIKKYPEIIELKRNQLLLQRSIKNECRK